MIWSVSTLARSSGTTFPVCTRNGCMPLNLAPVHVAPASRRLSRGRLALGPWKRDTTAAHTPRLRFKLPIPNVGKVPGNRGRRRHHRADQVRTPAAPLPPFEITIAGGSAALAGLQDIRI